MCLVQRHFTSESGQNFTLTNSLSLFYMKNAMCLLQIYYSSYYWAQNTLWLLRANMSDH